MLGGELLINKSPEQDEHEPLLEVWVRGPKLRHIHGNRSRGPNHARFARIHQLRIDVNQCASAFVLKEADEVLVIFNPANIQVALHGAPK